MYNIYENKKNDVDKLDKLDKADKINKINHNDKNDKNNRWSYSTRSDKINFISTMHIISLAVVLQFILYEALPALIYRFVYGFMFFDFFMLDEYYYMVSPDELYYILYNVVLIFIMVITSFITCVFLMLCLRKFGPKPDMYEYRDKVSYQFKLPKNTVALLFAGVCIVQFSVILNMLMNFALKSIFGISPESLPDMYFPQTVFGVILYFITMVILPAFLEEFIFRYLMLNALKKYGNAFAIITTSVLFGFAHARASAFIYATAVGIFMAYIAIKTKSMWFPMILHAAINAVSFAFQYVAALSFMTGETVDTIYFMFLTFISLVCLIYLITLIIKRRESGLNAPENQVNIKKSQKLLFFFNIASIIFFVLVILKSMEEYGIQEYENIDMIIRNMM